MMRRLYNYFKVKFCDHKESSISISVTPLFDSDHCDGFTRYIIAQVSCSRCKKLLGGELTGLLDDEEWMYTRYSGSSSNKDVDKLINTFAR